MGGTLHCISVYTSDPVCGAQLQAKCIYACGSSKLTPSHVIQATSAGAKDQEAENYLEKKFKGNPQYSYDEAVQTAIAALQGVLSEDFKASEIEVGVVRDDKTKAFRVLPVSEVEEHLTAISERD